ncbi:alpha/beta fold hydrolase [Anaeromicropila populeti]|uniref:Pimeloyl-ACP methyl ester carboxylesterase n=1 Tax=Anaeromicropila populeti TaxID=37658 RepID=A0A1I6KL35_9FIRM|nr:alpha/beta hydrolase [Anaeromicropila populeti]SFR91864.1 Pimeloyl-ACP methyl ester carboxylesterase [Anaeromicropila populeti]
MKVQIDKIDTNYVMQGEGETIVILPGWGCNTAVYKQITDSLSKHHKVICVDFPGAGDSSEPEEPWNVDDYVNFVITFLKKLHVKKASFIGHSNGGRVLLKLVSQKELPFEVEKLVFMGSAGIVSKKSMKQKFKIRMFKIAKVIFSIGVMKKLYPDFIENMRKKNGSADYNAASPVMRATLVKLVNEDLTHLLPGVKYSSLLIWGENDSATPLTQGKTFEKMIPDSGLVTVKNAGHYAFLEQPELVLRVLDSFYGVKGE